MLRIFRPGVIGTALLLAACTPTAEQIAAQQEQLRIQQAQDDAQCRSYGFRARSEGYANCRLELELARKPDVVYVQDPSPRFYGGFHHFHHR